jgi:hypothetical protein
MTATLPCGKAALPPIYPRGISRLSRVAQTCRTLACLRPLSRGRIHPAKERRDVCATPGFSTLRPSRDIIFSLRAVGCRNYLNPADLAPLQPHLDAAPVKRGPGEKFLDDPSGQFPCALVLFEDDGDVCSRRHVPSVSSIHGLIPCTRCRWLTPQKACRGCPLPGVRSVPQLAGRPRYKKLAKKTRNYELAMQSLCL